jgi:hypothetical protein
MTDEELDRAVNFRAARCFVGYRKPLMLLSLSREGSSGWPEIPYQREQMPALVPGRGEANSEEYGIIKVSNYL